MVDVVEESLKEIEKQEKELKRDLTSEEINKIIDKVRSENFVL